jgi:hypothetical protein
VSKKHFVKSTQSSAQTTATAARPDDKRTTSATQAGATGGASLRAVPMTSAEERARMIAEAAYYLSEQRGFAPGHEVEDWLAAEQQIDTRIEGGRGVIGPMQFS